METGKEKLRRALRNKECQLVLFSLCFGLLFLFCRMGSDDVRFYNTLAGKGVLSWPRWAFSYYDTWASRVLIFLSSAPLLAGGSPVLALYMAICMYVALKALTLLFSGDRKREVAVFALFMMALYPFQTLCEAGWISTVTNAFGPQAFGLMALVPIRKAAEKEKIKWWEFLFYCLCALYGANAEQMCAVLTVAYAVAIVYLLASKKNSWRVWVIEGLCVLSLVVALRCPGNWRRMISETRTWFPTFGVLDSVDKAELGLSTTLQWLFADGSAVVIVMCAMMAVFVWKRYKEPLFRAVAAVPVFVTLLLGPLKSMFSALFARAASLADSVAYYGAFTVEAQGGGKGPFQFAFFLVVAACVCVEIFLLSDTIEDLLTDLTLILMGVASRCAMGFSPTVYASGERTYAALTFCFIAAAVHIYSNNCHCLQSDGTGALARKYTMCAMGLANLIGLAVLIAVAFA